jgi:subtilisin family serine protease
VDVRIGHIDTGYTEHAALGWERGSSSSVHPDLGKDFWKGDHDQDGPRDPFLPGFPGHGTRISATISGFYPQANGGPFYGVAPGAQIIPYRVTDSVIVDHVQHHVRDAIRDAVASSCHVINISLGALRPSESLAEALDEAYDAGVIVVCAAGQVWGEVIYPGRFNRCVTMGGVGPGLTPWSSAATGIYVDLCGPADEIRRVQAEDLPSGQVATKIASSTGDGTSYATACCSGAAALWLAWHGLDNLKLKYGATGLWQIPKAFKYLAANTAKKGNWRVETTDKYGSGVLDIPALLKAPLPDPGVMRKENAAYGLFDNGSF